MADELCPTCQECCIDSCPGELKPRCLCDCPCIEAVIAPNQNLVAGTIMAQRLADGLWLPYDPNAADGSQYPRGVLSEHVVTDDNSNIVRSVHPWPTGCGRRTVCVYICGIFRNEDTHGNLAAALTNPGFGRLLKGFVGGAGEWKLL